MKYLWIFLFVLGVFVALLPYAGANCAVISFIQRSFKFNLNPDYLLFLELLGWSLMAISLLILIVGEWHKKKILRSLRRNFDELKEGGDGKRFEDFLTELFEFSGWKVYNPTSSTNASDQGVDLILSGKIAIQAKNYHQSHPTGNDAVQQVDSGMRYWKKNGFPRLKRAAVVSSSYFTRQAVELAKSLNVILKDAEDIESFLNGKPSKRWILKTSQKILNLKKR